MNNVPKFHAGDGFRGSNRPSGRNNFQVDLLDTFLSPADWIKALWLLIPPGFVLALIWLFRRPAANA